MFAQYTFIEEQHKLALTSVIHQQSYVTEAYLAKLYRAALDTLRPQSKVVPPDGTIAANCIKTKEATLATATDMNSGVFIQLADTGKGNMLTVGKKWAIQGFDPISSTTQTKLL